MIIPNELAMNKIANEWAMKMGHEWPIESFPMTGQLSMGHEWAMTHCPYVANL